MKCIWKYLKIWIILSTFCLVFKIFAYSLPDTMILKNVSESYQIMSEEGIYPSVGYSTEDGRISQQIDGWTDAIYLNVACEAGAHNVFEAVAQDYCGGEGDNPLDQLGYRINNIGEKVSAYGRQWFGAMIYIRPLLELFNIAEIRYLLQIVFWLLLIISYKMLLTKIDNRIAVSFLLGMLSIAPFAIGFSFNILNVFLVVFGMTIIICYKYKKESSMGVYLFVTGGLTAYLDLFLTPFVSFGVISLIILYYDYILNEESSVWKWIICIIKCAFFWTIGYLGVWVTKWMYASMVLNKNMFLSVWEEMKLVGNGSVPWGPPTRGGYIIESLKANSKKVFPFNFYLILKDESVFIVSSIIIVLFAILFIVWWRNKNKICEMKVGIAILAVTISPYIYYAIMPIHTFVHNYVEYRYQCITIMGLVLIYMLAIRKSKLSVD